jgi:hypothetical protein
MPKGEKLIGPKQKDHTTNLFSKNYLTKGEKFIPITKTLLTAKGRTFLGGDFIYPKEKHLKQGDVGEDIP